MNMDNSVFCVIRRIVMCAAMAVCAAGAWTQDVPKGLLDAAKSGDAEAQYELAKGYENGDYGTRMVSEGYYMRNEIDYESAFMWYQKSAEQGYDKAFAEMGRCYMDGKGVERDLDKAEYWFDKYCEIHPYEPSDYYDAFGYGRDEVFMDIERLHELQGKGSNRFKNGRDSTDGWEPLIPMLPY